MELRQLRYFTAVGERESFTRASEDLVIAQPALSAQVAKLEAELGVDLLERVGRHVRLTESGRLVLEQARRALAAADDVARVARLGAEGLVGRLTIGYLRSFPFRELTRLLRTYRRARPSVALDLREATSTAQLAAIRAGELDCGFTRIPEDLDSGELVAQTLCEVPAQIVVPAQHRLAKRRSITLRALADEDWVIISRAAGETFHDDIVAACRTEGFTPRIAQEAGDVRIVLGFVAAGLGVTIVTASSRDLGVRGIHYARLPTAKVFRFGLVARREARSPALAALFAEARAAARG